MNSDRSKDRSIPIIIFITTIIAYGLFLRRTGFYWDDWPFAWIAEFRGPREFIPAFDGVRPFLGPIFLLTTSLIPPVPLYWQIFALIIRFIAGLSAWFAFKQLWPDHRRQALIAALLFLLFPGYSQNWVALTHINQEWISFICYIFSFGLTGYALRNPTRFRAGTIAALLLLLPAAFPTEYFASIEPLRFLLIWAIIQEQTKEFSKRFIQSMKLWLPYLIVWLANAAWLLYFYTLGNYDSYDVDVIKQPLSSYEVIATFGESLWKVGIYIWGQVLWLVGQSITAPSSLLVLALIGAAFVVFVYYLRRLGSEPEPTMSIAFSAMVIGVAGILLGRVPSFAAGLPLTLQSSMDRFTISMMLGGTLFIVGLVSLFFRNSQARIYVFAFLIALAVGQQFFNANIFRRDWEKQQQILWQLSWRIPEMEEGTALLTDQLPIDYETDLSFTAPLNWMYAPDYTHGDLPYGMVYTATRLGKTTLSSFAPDTEIFVGIRAANFHGSTSKVIVIYLPEDGCLRVLDSALGDQVTYAKQSRFLVDAIPLSNPALIDVDSTRTPQIPFVPEPEHTWCYYFAKAELARQQGDWQKVVDLYDEAMSAGYKPGNPFEWLVVIEAHAMTGNTAAAQNLSETALAEDARVRPGVCQVWKRVQAADPARGELWSMAASTLIEYDCAP